MTVIFSNMKDADCTNIRKYLLSEFNFSEGSGNTLVEITPDMRYEAEKMVDEAISKEEDTLMFIGHGSINGLFFPNFSSGMYLLHENNIDLIRAKKVIGIWCNASTFAKDMGLKGFFTSMFVSNTCEGLFCRCGLVPQMEIDKMSGRFLIRVAELLRQGRELSEWREELISQMDPKDLVENYNYNGLMLFE